MKKIIYNISILSVFVLTSCTTGGFDENTKLDELNSAIAKAPSVVTISVNGEVLERNTVSVRQVDAQIGEVLALEFYLESGVKADLEELLFVQSFHGNAPVPVQEGSEDGINALSGQEMDFEYSYTVPSVDDHDDDVHVGDTIVIQLTVMNSEGYYGYKEFVVHIVE